MSREESFTELKLRLDRYLLAHLDSLELAHWFDGNHFTPTQ